MSSVKSTHEIETETCEYLIENRKMKQHSLGIVELEKLRTSF